jgi:hypothetical protein
MSGDIPPLLIYAFMAWTAVNLLYIISISNLTFKRLALCLSLHKEVLQGKCHAAVNTVMIVRVYKVTQFLNLMTECRRHSKDPATSS